MTHTTEASPLEPDPLTAFCAPPGTRQFGMWIGLIAIGMAFVAAISAYVVVAHRQGVALRVPTVLWLSTFIILVSSAVLHYALLSARLGHVIATRRAATAVSCLGLLFVALQVPGLTALLRAHHALAAQHVFLYGLAIVLVALHAAHVLGGLIPLLVIARRLPRRTMPQAADTLHIIGLYWHMLAAVWMGLFMMFLLAG